MAWGTGGYIVRGGGAPDPYAGVARTMQRTNTGVTSNIDPTTGMVRTATPPPAPPPPAPPTTFTPAPGAPTSGTVLTPTGAAAWNSPQLSNLVWDPTTGAYTTGTAAGPHVTAPTTTTTTPPPPTYPGTTTYGDWKDVKPGETPEQYFQRTGLAGYGQTTAQITAAQKAAAAAGPGPSSPWQQFTPGMTPEQQLAVRNYNLTKASNAYANDAATGYVPTWQDMAKWEDQFSDPNRFTNPFYADLVNKVGGQSILNQYINKYSYNPRSFAGFAAANPNWAYGYGGSFGDLTRAANKGTTPPAGTTPAGTSPIVNWLGNWWNPTPPAT